jgi:hypothetical protein
MRSVDSIVIKVYPPAKSTSAPSPIGIEWVMDEAPLLLSHPWVVIPMLPPGPTKIKSLDKVCVGILNYGGCP